MQLSASAFIAKWALRFASNDEFRITDADLRELTVDVADSFGQSAGLEVFTGSTGQPQAVKSGGFYVVGQAAIWRARYAFNASAAPIPGPNWELILQAQTGPSEDAPGDNDRLSLFKRVKCDTTANPQYYPGNSVMADITSRPQLLCLGTQILQVFPLPSRVFIIEYEDQNPEFQVHSECSTDSDLVGAKLVLLAQASAAVDVREWAAGITNWRANELITATYLGSTAFFRVKQAGGPYPAPSAYDDPYYRQQAPPVREEAMFQALTQNEGIALLDDRQVRRGRLYGVSFPANNAQTPPRPAVTVYIEGKDEGTFSGLGEIIDPGNGERTTSATVDVRANLVVSLSDANLRIASGAYFTSPATGELRGFAGPHDALVAANAEALVDDAVYPQFTSSVWVTPNQEAYSISGRPPTIFSLIRSTGPDTISLNLAANTRLNLYAASRISFAGGSGVTGGRVVWGTAGPNRIRLGTISNLELAPQNPDQQGGATVFTLEDCIVSRLFNPGGWPAVLRLRGNTTVPATLPAGVTLVDERLITHATTFAANAVGSGAPAGTLLEQLQWLASRGGGSGSTAPSITGAAPNSAATGATVMLYGANLSNPTSFTLGGTAITAYAVNQAGTAISFTVPPGASTGFISLTTANGTATSTGVFTVTTAGRLFADSVLERDNTTGNVQDTVAQLAGRSVVTVFSVCDKDSSAEGLHMLAGLLSPDGATMTDIAYFGSAFYANTPYPSRHGISYNTYTSATYTVDQAADALANGALALVETTLFNGTTPGAGELGEIRVNGVAQTLLKFNPGMQADRAFNGVFVTGGGRDAAYDWPGYVKNFLFFGNLSDTRRAEIRAVLRQQFPALPQ